MSTTPLQSANSAWTPPPPRQLPTWRRELVAGMADEVTITGAARSIANGFGQVLPPAAVSAEQWAARIHAEEGARLSSAELYFAEAEPTKLAMSVAGDFADDVLTPDAAPSAAGLIVFAEPIGAYLSDGVNIHELGGGHRVATPVPPGAVSIVAASWGPYTPQGVDDAGMWFTFWAPRDIELQMANYFRGIGVDHPDPSRAQHLRASLRRQGPLSWDDEWVVPFGYPPRWSNPSGTPNGLGWLNVVRATWTLMVTPGMAQVGQLRESKTDAKRRARAAASPALREPEEVRVVTMRTRMTSGKPEVSEQAGDRGGRVYSWRWAVRAHTRMQPFGPGRSQTKRILIDPYIKGPEDKPLKPPAETVHLWKG